MDKEMKAKIDEFLKTNGRRELSMDEMDKVVGGGCGFYGPLSADNIDDYGNIIQGIINTMGLDVAIAWANEYVVQSRHNSEWLKAGGVAYWKDEFRKVWKRGNGY